jgi:hypothetical protein
MTNWTCPETSAPCERMCLTMCHIISEDRVALRAEVERLRAELAKPCTRCHCMDRAIEKMGDPRDSVTITPSTGLSPRTAQEGT